MELGELRVALGLFCEFDLRKNWIGRFESMQEMEVLECSEMEGFCVFNPYL